MFGEAFDGNDQLLGSYTQEGDARQRVLLLAALPGVPRDVFMRAFDEKQQKGTDQIANLWAQRRKNYRNEPQPDGIGRRPEPVARELHGQPRRRAASSSKRRTTRTLSATRSSF